MRSRFWKSFTAIVSVLALSAFYALPLSAAPGDDWEATGVPGEDAEFEEAGLSAMSSDDELVVVIDAGHGGKDPGAVGNNIYEKDVNLKIALYMKAELELYAGVTVVMTRTGDTYPTLQDRVDIAVAAKADVLVALHNNSSDSSSPTGCEVYVPNTSSYNSSVRETGAALGQTVVNLLSMLGLKNRGIYARNYSTASGAKTNEYYSDGSYADYYYLIRNSRRNDIPAIIVEHAFLSNASDAAFLSNETNLQNLGIADATALACYYQLQKYSELPPDGATTVFRLYNPNSGLHHLTTDLAERSYLVSLGWKSEGVSFYASAGGGTPVYRVYNPNDGNHHFTSSKEEYDWLVGLGWQAEGIAWYTSTDASTTVYRLYNPNNGEHHFTTSEQEYSEVIAAGWTGEGFAWYSM